MLKNIIKNPMFKKGFGILSVGISVYAAIDEVISGKKQEEKIRMLEKAVDELKNK